jgi:hypothetical protein
MTHEQAEEYERRVLAACCPEVGIHRNGQPDYARYDLFKCPEWLRPPPPVPGDINDRSRLSAGLQRLERVRKVRPTRPEASRAGL